MFIGYKVEQVKDCTVYANTITLDAVIIIDGKYKAWVGANCPPSFFKFSAGKWEFTNTPPDTLVYLATKYSSRNAYYEE